MKLILSSQAVVTSYSFSRLNESSAMYMNGTGFVVPPTDGCIADVQLNDVTLGQSSLLIWSVGFPMLY